MRSDVTFWVVVVLLALVLGYATARLFIPEEYTAPTKIEMEDGSCWIYNPDILKWEECQ